MYTVPIGRLYLPPKTRRVLWHLCTMDSRDSVVEVGSQEDALQKRPSPSLRFSLILLNINKDFSIAGLSKTHY